MQQILHAFFKRRWIPSTGGAMCHDLHEALVVAVLSMLAARVRGHEGLRCGVESWLHIV